jgi:O-succinylhomoserine sulfhydrylase
VRSAGPTLSAFNAWVLLSGLETLFVRMERQCANALQLACWLETHPAIEKVYYPGLPSHPQHELAMRQQTAGGAVVSFIVKGGREAAWKLIDSTQLVSITANLGDVKTTITHPATTTHGRVAPEVREKAGIVEGLVRVAVGLEHPADVKQIWRADWKAEPKPLNGPDTEMWGQERICLVSETNPLFLCRCEMGWG